MFLFSFSEQSSASPSADMAAETRVTGSRGAGSGGAHELLPELSSRGLGRELVLGPAVAAIAAHFRPRTAAYWEIWLDGDEISKLSRIRLTAGTGELLVMAACSTTAALAAVTIDEDSRAVVGGILDPDDGL